MEEMHEKCYGLRNKKGLLSHCGMSHIWALLCSAS